jgi:hypothetical protein
MQSELCLYLHIDVRLNCLHDVLWQNLLHVAFCLSVQMGQVM